jgi:hypothetical protein
MPIVSVIVPNYGQVRILRRRIVRILTQILRDFELIMLNDRGRTTVGRFSASTPTRACASNSTKSTPAAHSISRKKAWSWPAESTFGLRNRMTILTRGSSSSARVCSHPIRKLPLLTAGHDASMRQIGPVPSWTLTRVMSPNDGQLIFVTMGKMYAGAVSGSTIPSPTPVQSFS